MTDQVSHQGQAGRAPLQRRGGTDLRRYQCRGGFKAGALVGRGSGEALQVAFHGNGFVIVQPSEGITVTAQ
jgi:hypothetical protein